jgi:hypothetical protein
MRILVLSIVLLAVGSVAAQAEDPFADRRKCIREMFHLIGEMATAKRLCDPKNYVTDPNEYGWGCPSGNSPERVKGVGAAKQKKDVLCE